MEMDIKTLTTGEIIELVRSRRRIEHSITKQEKRLLLKELFDRGKESAMCDSTLHDVLYSLLPTSPNGDEKLQTQQIQLANQLTSMLSEVDEEGFLDWSEFPANVLLDMLDVTNESSRPKAIHIARTIYEELWYREMENQVSESTFYSYIRKQIPSTNKEFFRSVAEELVRTIIKF